MFRKLLKYAADQVADTVFTIGGQAYLFYSGKPAAWMLRDDVSSHDLGVDVLKPDEFVRRVFSDLQDLGVLDVVEIPPELAEAVQHSLDDMRDAEIAAGLARLFEERQREVPYA